VLVHQETCPHLDRTLRMIKSEGARAGVVINPATPVSMLDEVLDVADYVLIMSVNPGFGGSASFPTRSRKFAASPTRKRTADCSSPSKSTAASARNVAECGECRGRMGGGRVVDFHTVNRRPLLKRCSSSPARAPQFEYSHKDI